MRGSAQVTPTAEPTASARQWRLSASDISAGRRLGARDVAGRRARSGWPAVRRAWIYIYI